MFKTFLIGMLTLSISSCDGEFISTTTLPAPVFSGISQLSSDSERSYVVSWNKPSSQAGDVIYKIYLLELNEIPQNAIPTGEVNTRNIFIYEFKEENSPALVGENIAIITDNRFNYTIPKEFDENIIYAFQVKAINTDGIEDINTKTIVLNSYNQIEYKGCLTSTATKDSITLGYEFLENSSKINIYRDGQLIHSSISKNQLTYTDTNLESGREYSYICEAEVGENRFIGSQLITANTLDPLDNYEGCLSSKALGGYSILLKFSVPDEADKIFIRRNGEIIYSASPEDIFENILPSENDASNLETGNKVASLIDRKLEEGVTYRYICTARVGNMTRSGEKTSAKTLSTNAPTFQGIFKAEALSAHEIKVTWGTPTNVSAAYYEIYMSLGNTLDYSEPIATVDAGTLTYNLNGLGDEITYTLGVRACSESKICDENTQVKSAKTLDGGAPQTIGITNIVKEKDKFYVIAPWDHKNGALATRKIFRMSGISPSSNFSDYSDYGANGLETSISVVNIPIEKIELPPLEAYKKYFFILKDYDSKGQTKDNFNTFEFSTGDLTKPIWVQGVKSLTKPTDENFVTTRLVANFEGVIDEETNATTGGSTIEVYVLEQDPSLALSSPVSACSSSGILQAEIPAKDYPYINGTDYSYNIDNLKPRTYYSVCLKLKDSANNISETSTSLVGLTKDRTPPYFSGIQVVAIDGKLIRLFWNPSSSTDLYSYRIKFWTDTHQTPVEIPEIKNVNSELSFYDINPLDYAEITSASEITAVVNACDNFGLMALGEENCTTYTNGRTLNQLPDFAYPLGFNGIKSASTDPSQEGKVTITWDKPADEHLTDYVGFSIYNTVNEKIDGGSIGNCSCALNDCVNNYISECSLTLTPGKPYNLAVNAFDLSNNETPYVGKYSSTIYPPDLTAPEFNGGSFIDGYFDQLEKNIKVQFQMASDNQYDQSNRAISYNIYRVLLDPNTHSSCSSTSISDIDISDENYYASHVPLSTEVRTTMFKDNGIISNGIYLYRISAIDQNTITVDSSLRNNTVDSAFTCTQAGDIVPPQFIGGTGCNELEKAGGCVTLHKKDDLIDAKEWYLSWDMDDNHQNGTAKENLLVQIYVTETDSSIAPDPGENLEFLIKNNYRKIESKNGIQRFPVTDGEWTTGPAKLNKWVHYVVVVSDMTSEDTVANSTYTSASVYSENQTIIQGISRRSSAANVNNLVVISGTGFLDTTKIYFNEVIAQNECTNPTVVKFSNNENPELPIKKIICTTPLWSLGAATKQLVRIIAVNGTEEHRSPPEVTFKFYNYGTEFEDNHVCDNPDNRNNTLSANQGSGTEESPYLICNYSQLHSVIDNTSNFIQIQDNIDFTNVNWSPTYFKGYLDGKGYYLFNLSNPISTDFLYSGFFRILSENSSISNLSLANFTINNADNCSNKHLGLLAGRIDSPHDSPKVNIDNVHISGEIDCSTHPFTVNRIGAGLMGGYVDGLRVVTSSVYGKLNLGTNADKELVAGGFFGIQADYQFIIENSHTYIEAQNFEKFGSVCGECSWLKLVANYKAYIKTEEDSKNRTSVGGVVGELLSPGQDNILKPKRFSSVEIYGDLFSHEVIGGIIGRNYVEATFIENIKMNANLTSSSASSYAGGIVGINKFDAPAWAKDWLLLSIQDAQVSGNINANTNQYGTGGAVGVSIRSDFLTPHIQINNFIFDGALKAHRWAGGIIGRVGHSTYSSLHYHTNIHIRNSLVSGTVDAYNYVGGVMGAYGTKESIQDDGYDDIQSIVSSVAVTGMVKGRYYVGGLFGSVVDVDLEILDSYSSGEIYGDEYVGGIVGINTHPNKDIILTDCYVTSRFFPNYTGRVVKGGALIGIGTANSLNGCYYATDLIGTDVSDPISALVGYNETRYTASKFSSAFNFNWNTNRWNFEGDFPVLVHLESLYILSNK